MGKVKSAVLAMLMICCLPCLAGAQGTQKDAVALVRQRMQAISESGAVIVTPVETRDILSGDQRLVLPELQKYENHRDARVRCDTWVLEWAFAVKAPDLETRRAVVAGMAKACGDTDLRVVTAVIERLECMDKEDFNDEAKDAIRAIMASNSPKKGRVVALCGVADMRDEIPRLQAMLVDEIKLEPTMRYQAFWRARLALARMGSQTDIAQCIKVVQSDPDPVRRVAVLLRHLAFTRQPQVVPVLREYLDSVERLPADGDDVPSVPHCDYALNVLARTLRDFPVNYQGTVGYKQAEINTAREWMKTHDQSVFKKRIEDAPFL